MVRIEAAHEIRLAATDSDRHATPNGFSIDHQIGLDAEVFLRTPGRQTEA